MKPCPRDHLTEAAVLGALMLKPAAMPSVMAEVDASDFDAARHRVLWGALTSLDREQIPIDVYSVMRALRAADAGGLVTMEYLSEITDDYSAAHNVVDHARALRDIGLARRVWIAANECLERDPLEDPAAWASDLASDVLRAAETGRRTRRTIADQVESALRQVDDARKGLLVTVPTMSAAVNGILDGGMREGELVVVAGRPGMGKSAMAMGCILRNAVRDTVPVDFFSLEMTAESQVLRGISSVGMIDSHGIRGRGLNDEKFARFIEAAKKIAKAPIDIDDDVSDLDQVEARCRVWRMRTKAVDARGRGLIVVDYAQLVEADEESRQLAVSAVSRTMKRVALRLKVPVLLLSQVNRACEARQDKRPMLSDLRESGSIEQDADCVMFLYRHGQYFPQAPQHQAECIVAKQRNGRTGVVPLHWDGEHMTFRDVETNR